MEINDRNQFLNMAALFEGGLVVVAFGLGWFADIDPVEHLNWQWQSFIWGLLAALPMFALFLIFHRYPIGPFRHINDFLVDFLGPVLSQCFWFDLILLGLLAGLTEEILFRGFFQAWFSQFGPGMGILGSNILFGLVHFVTATYAILAGLMGWYFSWLLTATGETNLLVPITTHAFYDYLAFLMVVRTYQKRSQLKQIDQPEQANSDSAEQPTTGPDET